MTINRSFALALSVISALKSVGRRIPFGIIALLVKIDSLVNNPNFPVPSITAFACTEVPCEMTLTPSLVARVKTYRPISSACKLFNGKTLSLPVNPSTGIQKIPAIVKEVADEKLLELALIENIQRQELNPIDEARAYKNLIETLGFTQEMLAERVGKNRTVVTTFLRLLKLPKDIQQLVEEEKISAGHARALLMSNDVESQRRLANRIIEMSLSVRETERAVKRIGRNNGQTANQATIKSKKDANIKAAETKLKRYLGTQLQIFPDGKGTGGKIEVEYYSESDLDRIYRLILNN